MISETTTKWLIGGAVAVAAITAFSFWPNAAKAADLGGNCCSDLEERIADLEATAARKGNRKVSLTLSGYVSHAVMYWDDGGQSDVYVGDGGMNSSRFRFEGTAKISTSVTAGFTYEFGANSNALGAMNQTDGGDDLGGGIILRDSTVWLKHSQLGRVKIGQGSTATDNLVLLDVSNAAVASSPDVALWNGGFFLRSGLVADGGVLVPITWGNILNQGVSFDTTRRNHVAYQSPTIAGFMLEAAAGEDNFWDVALRYAHDLGTFRVAAAVGYSVDTEAPVFNAVPALAFTGIPANDIKTAMAAVSIKHMTSGLFVTAAGAKREIEWRLDLGGGASLSAKDATMWHVKAGWEKNVTGLGLTTIYGEYHNAKDMVGFSSVALANLDVSSKATVFGAGLVQHVDAADMDVFIAYKQYSGDIDLKFNGASGSLDVKDFQTVIVGTKIAF